MGYKEAMGYFTQDAREVLSKIVVSLKQNLRIINKTTNVYRHFDATVNRVYQKQKTGDSWAIRKPMHKDTVFGAVNLRKSKSCAIIGRLGYSCHDC